MKSDRKAKQGKEAERPKLGKSALRIPDADRCNGTALRKANRRVSQLYDAVLAPWRHSVDAALHSDPHRSCRQTQYG